MYKLPHLGLKTCNWHKFVVPPPATWSSRQERLFPLRLTLQCPATHIRKHVHWPQTIVLPCHSYKEGEQPFMPLLFGYWWGLTLGLDTESARHRLLTPVKMSLFELSALLPSCSLCVGNQACWDAPVQEVKYSDCIHMWSTVNTADVTIRAHCSLMYAWPPDDMVLQTLRTKHFH